MKLLIIGSNGMLGQALRREARSRKFTTLGVDLQHADVNVDITDDAAVTDALVSTTPDLVVNCAAIVDVPLCDADPLLAWNVNARCVGVIAEASRALGAKFVQISTDHYFTGNGNARHDEEAPVTLYNEYARTKFAGEAFAAVCPNHLVLRTNIIGFRGHGKPTFAEWAFDAVERDAEMTLFHDSYVSSIDVNSFSSAVLDLAGTSAKGLYNLASADVFSKQQLIVAIARALNCPLTRASSGSVRNLDVSRADSCGLNVSKAEAALGYKMPALKKVVESLITQRKQP